MDVFVNAECLEKYHLSDMQDLDRERATDIPTVLLANCWSLIAAERRRFVVT